MFEQATELDICWAHGSEEEMSWEWRDPSSYTYNIDISEMEQLESLTIHKFNVNVDPMASG